MSTPPVHRQPLLLLHGVTNSAQIWAEVIPLLCVARAVQRLPITREFSLALIDGVIIPALRGGGRA